MPVQAEVYLDVVRRDLLRGMELAVMSVHRTWNDGPPGGIRL